MSNPRERMLAAFTDILVEATAKIPGSAMSAVPIGRLADAAFKVVSEVPRPPAYDPDVTPDLVFSGVLHPDDAAKGHTYDTARVFPADDSDDVVFLLHDGAAGTDAEVRLPVDDAETFLLSGLSVVGHQRARKEADGE